MALKLYWKSQNKKNKNRAKTRLKGKYDGNGQTDF